jgi:hypothetical protein
VKTFSARIKSVGASSYAAPPVEAFEAWRDRYIAIHPTVKHTLLRAAVLRRMVMLRAAGDCLAEIARCCGVSASCVAKNFKRLPADLRGPLADH